MRSVVLGGRHCRHGQHRTIGAVRPSGEHCRRSGDRGYAFRLLRQDNPVSVVVRGDKFDDVISRHPVTVGREAGTQRPEDQEQEAGQQPFGW